MVATPVAVAFAFAFAVMALVAFPVPFPVTVAVVPALPLALATTLLHALMVGRPVPPFAPTTAARVHVVPADVAQPLQLLVPLSARPVLPFQA